MSMDNKSAVVECYLFFGGRCEEAINFYQAAIGAQVEFIMRYSESPDKQALERIPPGFEDKVMHASFTIGETRVMASDGCEAGQSYGGFSLSLSLPDEAEVVRAFNALSEGGTVTMPLEKTFWSPKFGMLTDKFGIGWMLSVLSAEPQ
jgi:PhnB protein